MASSGVTAELLTQLFDGQLSEDDVAALDRELAGSESARLAYVEAIYLREGMRRWACSRGAADELQVISFAAALDVTGLNASTEEQPTIATGATGTPNRHGNQKGDYTRHFGATLFAGLAVALLVFLGLRLGAPPANINSATIGFEASSDLTRSEQDDALSESKSVVARLTAATSDVRWRRGRVPSDFLMRFRPGDILGIDSGIAQVEFSGGARLVLCSPAMIQFTGGTTARLMQGCVTGRAENTNFALVTPTATVVDIGTEFGVGVGPEGTDVTVFEGELHVHSLLKSGEGGPMRRVREGMSMRIDAEGSQIAPSAGDYEFRRDLLHPTAPTEISNSVSLLDLIGGHDYYRSRIAGSIDPRSGYWGKPPWLGHDSSKARRGDTQFTATPWNRMVDGVFIPRANAREMQIDSDGHVVHLPPNSGTSWGPIWSRRLSDLDLDEELAAASDHDQWGGGTLATVHSRLLTAQEGLLGLHANVGITFDLNEVRRARGVEVVKFCAQLLNLGLSNDPSEVVGESQADLRIFVDGKLKFSRLGFNSTDGEAAVDVALSSKDRYLTIVATDSDGDPRLDHVVFVDPVLQTEDAPPMAQQATLRDLYASSHAWGLSLPALQRR